MTPHTDPSGLYGAAVTALGALLAVVVAFGVDLTETQTEAILGLATALMPLVVAILIRRKAYAPATVDAIRARYRNALEDDLELDRHHDDPQEA